MSKNQKLAQRRVISKGNLIDIGLTGNIGYISIEDNNLYPETDSRCERRDLMFNKIMIPLMSREDLKDLKNAIEEVLKNSK